MKCPFCKSRRVHVVDVRECPRSGTRRRYECDVCLKRFTAYEYHEKEIKTALEILKVLEREEGK